MTRANGGGQVNPLEEGGDAFRRLLFWSFISQMLRNSETEDGRR